MLVELKSLDSIQPYPDNPRRNAPAVDAVARSIREFGFRQPLVIDADGVIVVGHTRYLAARELGLDEVPVHVAWDLSPEQARAYRLADNRTASIATWDDEGLVRELLALQASDVDLHLTGFSDAELDRLIAQAGGTTEADPDQTPEAPVEPITQPGDLWLLGNHRLLCGDATRPEDVARLLGDEPIDLLLTDPPYGIDYVGKTEERLTIQNDGPDEAGYRRLVADALTAALPHLRPGGAFYLWHADSMGLPTRLALGDSGLSLRQCLVWAKSAFTLGRQDYQWQHEPCLYGWKDGAAHTWLGDRSQTTLLHFDKPARNGEHPTMKPVELFAYLIGNSCPRGGRVLDPFAGSGTTLIAAEQTGREARLIELDPRYADVIVARYEQFTGAKGERIG